MLGVILFGGFILAWAIGHQLSVSIDSGTVPQELLEERALPPIPPPIIDGETGASEAGGHAAEEVVE